MSKLGQILVLALLVAVGCDAPEASINVAPVGPAAPIPVVPAGAAAPELVAISAAPIAAAPGCDCEPGATLARACGSDVGVCQRGTQERACLASCTWGPWGECGGGAVAATAEACGNQIDDDCDGQVDEGCACAPAAAGEAGGFWVPGPVIGMTADPSRCLLYGLAGGTHGELVVVDTALKQEIARVDLGQRSHAFDMSSDGSWLVFAGVEDTSDLVVIQPPDWNDVRHIPSGQVDAVAVSRAGRVYYLSHHGLYALDLVTGQLDRSFGAVSVYGQMQLSPDERSLYVSDVGVTPGGLQRFAIGEDGTIERGSRSPHELLVDLGFGDYSLSVSSDGRSVSYQGFRFDALDLTVVHGALGTYLNDFAASGGFGVDAFGVFDVELMRPLGRTPTYSRFSALAPGDQEMWSYDHISETLHYANVADYLDPAQLGRHEWPAAPLAQYQFSRLVVDPRRPWLYGLDSRFGEVVIIDRATLTPVEGILVGTAASDLALDRGGRYLYVGHEYSWGVARINLDELAFAGFQPTHLATSTVAALGPGRLASAGGYSHQEVQLLDTDTPQVLDPGYLNHFYLPDLAASPDGTQVYVAESGSSASCLAVFDATGERLVRLRELPFTQCAYYAERGIVAIPGTTDVFWAGSRWRTSNLTRVYQMTQPQGADVILTVTPDARLALSASQVYDAATGALRGPLPVTGTAQAVSADGTTLYVSPAAGGVATVNLTAF